MDICLRQVDKIYYRFLVLSGKVWWTFLIGSFWPKIEAFYGPKWTKRVGGHMKRNFEYFQIQKWMSQTIRAGKADGKHGVISLVSIFPSRVVVLKLCKRVISFLKFCADFSKKS